MGRWKRMEEGKYGGPSHRINRWAWRAQERQQERSDDSDASRHAAGLAATRLTRPAFGFGGATRPFLWCCCLGKGEW